MRTRGSPARNAGVKLLAVSIAAMSSFIGAAAPPARQALDLTAIDVAFAASLASALGALFILCNWLCNPPARRLFFLRLIAYLSVANLLSSASYLMSFVEWRALHRGGADDALSRAWCLAQALLMVTFENASVLWTVAIALALHAQVVRRDSAERHEARYHAVAWGAPAAAAAALALTGRLGPADEPREAWCWIASNSGPRTNGTAAAERLAGAAAGRGGGWGAAPFVVGGGADTRYLQLLVFYLPLLAAFCFNLGAYVRVGRAFGRMAREGAVERSKERMIQLRLRLYLLVFLLVWTVPLVHRTLQLIGCSWCDPEWLRILHTATQCSLGWLNMLVYGCNEATLRPYRDALAQLSCNLLSGLQLAGGSRRGAAGRQYGGTFSGSLATAPMLATEGGSCASVAADSHTRGLPSSMAPHSGVCVPVLD
jgi:hypothetical protein